MRSEVQARYITSQPSGDESINCGLFRSVQRSNNIKVFALNHRDLKKADLLFSRKRKKWTLVWLGKSSPFGCVSTVNYHR